MKVKQLELIILLFSILTFSVILAAILYSYSKWKKLKGSISRYKRKVIKSIPHIEHPEYRRIRYSNLCYNEAVFDKELAITLVSSIMSTYNISSGYDPLLDKNIKRKANIGQNGILYTMGNDYIISFRGTMTPKDLFADLDIAQTPFKANYFSAKDVLVHRGFYKTWETHKLDIKKLSDISGTIYITGHSLGAALAAYTALDLSKSPSKPKIVLYTFGSPRVGNQYFIDELTKAVPNNWAHINVRDIVCDLPPSNCPMFTATYIYDDFRRVHRSDYQTGEILSNHHIESYLNCLEAKSVDVIWHRPDLELITV